MAKLNPIRTNSVRNFTTTLALPVGFFSAMTILMWVVTRLGSEVLPDISICSLSPLNYDT